VPVDALEELATMGINLNSHCCPVHGGTIFNPRFVPREITSRNPIFYLVKRGPAEHTLDATLKHMAQHAGVELRFVTLVEPSEVDIVATGPQSARVVAAGITFTIDRSDGAYVILNNDLAPHGYAYLLIAGGQATLATVLFHRFREARGCLDVAIDTFSQLLTLDSIENPRTWGGYGSFGVPHSAIRNGRLWVGEAAGFQDFLFGFGIRYAMVSGFLAAKSILEDLDYDLLWKRRHLHTLKASLSNRFIFSRLGNLASHGLWLALGHADNPITVMRWLTNWTLSRRLVYPIAKAHTFAK
jgi:hypothetical protein